MTDAERLWALRQADILQAEADTAQQADDITYVGLRRAVEVLRATASELDAEWPS